MTQDAEEQDEAMNCGLGVAERERLRSKLQALPDTMPPRAVWQRIETQARAEGLLRREALKPPAKWFAGAGLAAAVVLAVLNFESLSPGPVATGPVAMDRGEMDRGEMDRGEMNDTQSFPTEPPYTGRDRSVRLRALNALMVQSRQLEQDLRALPEEPQLVRAGTAATIAAVEDQIAAIDYRLNYSPLSMTHEQMELYWRERVRLMNLLVQLRTAQAQRNAF